ncbi:MAG TPA: hypothetical protein VGL13_03410 [Polyangiaceae bacterium]|jgi:hypothetical protein
MNDAIPPTNGGGAPPALALVLPPAPAEVKELADACVRYVEAVYRLRLDFQPETLSVLDHYLASRRPDFEHEPQAAGLIARVAAAYFGEVVRHKFSSFWHLGSEDDPSTWQLRFEAVYLSFSPYEIAYDAITLGDQGEPTAQLNLDDEDRDVVEERLAELPPASDEEFFALTTRLEVLEIAVDAIKARMMSNGLGEVGFSSEDYERD